MFFTLFILFITCELGGQISSDFDGINDQINQFDWYLCPLKVQKILPPIMANLQQPVEFKCFGSFACNRDTFKAVSLSYWFIWWEKQMKITECLMIFVVPLFQGGKMFILILHDTTCIRVEKKTKNGLFHSWEYKWWTYYKVISNQQ